MSSVGRERGGGGAVEEDRGIRDIGSFRKDKANGHRRGRRGTDQSEAFFCNKS